MKISIMLFFVPKQGSKMRRTIKEQDDKLSTAKQKYEETAQEVSLFDELFFTAMTLTSLFLEFKVFPTLGQDDK